MYRHTEQNSMNYSNRVLTKIVWLVTRGKLPYELCEVRGTGPACLTMQSDQDPPPSHSITANSEDPGQTMLTKPRSPIRISSAHINRIWIPKKSIRRTAKTPLGLHKCTGPSGSSLFALTRRYPSSRTFNILPFNNSKYFCYYVCYYYFLYVVLLLAHNT